MYLTPRKHHQDPDGLARAEEPGTQPAGQHEELCAALLAAWPSDDALDVILEIPVEITGYLHGLICTPSSSQGQMPPPREILQLPPAGSHPVLVARKLLILGSYLQAVPPCSIQSLSHQGINHHDIMSRVVDTARGLVSCDDELVASVEGIECITIESMYHNNAGNLRRAWLTMRRAMLIAQTMGLHRGRDPPSITKTPELARIRPDHVWLRLVQSDRYLSLMLGLPQGAPERNFFATPRSLESCTATERLQRIDCVVAGRILQRDEADINDLAATQEIDKLLHTASMSMPPQSWLIPDLTSSKIAGDSMEHFRETVRLMDQFTHYHLLARLHLPYLLRPLADRKYEYSKFTAINASREVLARFVAFRASNPVGSYCRGIDFLAFIASTTLCLAHIDAHHQGRVFAGNIDDGIFFRSLIHQRPLDRGMMERALDSVEHMASANADTIASKIADIFRHLLVVEADAADGGSYKASSITSSEDELECSGRLSDGGGVLRIYIPCFGTIKIERGILSRSDENPATLRSEAPGAIPDVSFSASLHKEGQNEQARQPLHMMDCNIEWQAVPGHLAAPVTPQHFAPATSDQSLSNFHGDGIQGAGVYISGMEVGTEDWALQGVDMALFDSLIRGSELDAVGMSYRTQ